MQQTPPPVAPQSHANANGVLFAVAIVLGLIAGAIAGLVVALWGFTVVGNVKHAGWIGLGVDLIAIAGGVFGIVLMKKGVNFVNGLLVGLAVGLLGPMLTCGLVFFGAL